MADRPRRTRERCPSDKHPTGAPARDLRPRRAGRWGCARRIRAGERGRLLQASESSEGGCRAKAGWSSTPILVAEASCIQVFIADAMIRRRVSRSGRANKNEGGEEAWRRLSRG